MFGAGGYLKGRSTNLTTVGVARLPNNPVPGVRTPNLLREIAFDWKDITGYIEEMGTKESFEKSLELCRAGIMAGASSGFALAGLLNFLSKLKEDGELNKLRNSDGEIVAVFICPDSPLPYLNEYFEYLDASHFPKIENEELLINKPSKNEKKAVRPGTMRSSRFELGVDKAYEMNPSTFGPRNMAAAS